MRLTLYLLACIFLVSLGIAIGSSLTQATAVWGASMTVATLSLTALASICHRQL